MKKHNVIWAFSAQPGTKLYCADGHYVCTTARQLKSWRIVYGSEFHNYGATQTPETGAKLFPWRCACLAPWIDSRETVGLTVYIESPAK